MTLASVPVPVLVWTALHVLGVLMSIREPLSFGLTLGVGALSCGLLLGGFPNLFAGFELLFWMLCFSIIILTKTVAPPGDPRMGSIDGLAVRASIRFASAVAIWLWL